MQSDRTHGFATDESPERRLFSSVILQAIQDALFQTDQCNEYDQLHALAFLTHRTGRHAESRRFYCDALGMDDGRLRGYVIAVLKAEIEPRSVYSAEQVSKRSAAKLFAARQRWADAQR